MSRPLFEVGLTFEEALANKLVKRKWHGGFDIQGYAACFVCRTIRNDLHCFFPITELVSINGLYFCHRHVADAADFKGWVENGL